MSDQEMIDSDSDKAAEVIYSVLRLKVALSKVTLDGEIIEIVLNKVAHERLVCIIEQYYDMSKSYVAADMEFKGIAGIKIKAGER